MWRRALWGGRVARWPKAGKGARPRIGGQVPLPGVCFSTWKLGMFWFEEWAGGRTNFLIRNISYLVVSWLSFVLKFHDLFSPGLIFAHFGPPRYECWRGCTGDHISVQRTPGPVPFAATGVPPVDHRPSHRPRAAEGRVGGWGWGWGWPSHESEGMVGDGRAVGAGLVEPGGLRGQYAA